MATRTLYGFDEDGNKIAVGSYSDSLTVTLVDETGGFFELSGAGEYNQGDSCTITATKIGGPSSLNFGYWMTATEDVLSSSNPFTFTVTEDVTIIAHGQIGKIG